MKAPLNLASKLVFSSLIVSAFVHSEALATYSPICTDGGMSGITCSPDKKTVTINNDADLLIYQWIAANGLSNIGNLGFTPTNLNLQTQPYTVSDYKLTVNGGIFHINFVTTSGAAIYSDGNDVSANNNILEFNQYRYRKCI